jgi:hypothetical protein
VNRRDTSGRNSRYFLASTLILVGLACAALMTDSIGNTLATGLIAIGLAMFIAFLFKDLGLNVDGRSSPGVPELPPLPDPEPEPRPEPGAADTLVSPEQARAAAEGVHSAAEAARRAAGFGNGAGNGHGNGGGNGSGGESTQAPPESAQPR